MTVRRKRPEPGAVSSSVVSTTLTPGRSLMSSNCRSIVASRAGRSCLTGSSRPSSPKTSEPPARKGGVMVGSVAELVTKLKSEAGVL